MRTTFSVSVGQANRLRLLVAFLLVVSGAAAAQTTSTAPSWATPVDDATQQQVGQAADIRTYADHAALAVGAAPPHVPTAAPTNTAAPPRASTASAFAASSANATRELPMVSIPSLTQPPATKEWVTDGKSLRGAVNKWVAMSGGWHVLWKKPDGADSTMERTLDVPLQFQGTFKDAMEQMVRLFHSKGDKLYIDSWPQFKTITITDAN
jgi:hypothetical protein